MLIPKKDKALIYHQRILGKTAAFQRDGLRKMVSIGQEIINHISTRCFKHFCDNEFFNFFTPYKRRSNKYIWMMFAWERRAALRN